jgi:hypothetical protein
MGGYQDGGDQQYGGPGFGPRDMGEQRDYPSRNPPSNDYTSGYNSAGGYSNRDVPRDAPRDAPRGGYSNGRDSYDDSYQRHGREERSQEYESIWLHFSLSCKI